MITKTKDPSKAKNIDAMRMKKYIGCFVYKNRLLPLEDLVKSKKCTKCASAINKKRQPKPHFCTVNHEGSSGAMEAELALDLVTEMHTVSQGRVFIHTIVSDDDSTMRSLLKHKKINSKGKLPEAIPEPIFMADPSHRVKVMAKPFF